MEPAVFLTHDLRIEMEGSHSILIFNITVPSRYSKAGAGEDIVESALRMLQAQRVSPRAARVLPEPTPVA